MPIGPVLLDTSILEALVAQDPKVLAALDACASREARFFLSVLSRLEFRAELPKCAFPLAWAPLDGEAAVAAGKMRYLLGERDPEDELMPLAMIAGTAHAIGASLLVASDERMAVFKQLLATIKSKSPLVDARRGR